MQDDPTQSLPASTPAPDPGRIVSRPLVMGDRVGRFRIERELGQGGFGCVYLAHDDVLKREVALKLPRALLNSHQKTRFMREAEAAAALEHVGIVPVYEAGESDGQNYIASAFCPGQNLSQWLKSQSEVSIQHCAQILRCLAEAMQHAHNRRVVHRDLKPGNVMLVPVDGECPGDTLGFVPRITDFGLAKLVEQRLEDTHSSAMLGTPSYMAPEQFESSVTSVSPFSTDIYALGVILYEAITGHRPHAGNTVVEIIDAVRDGKVRPPSELRADLPRDLETICLKCLNRRPEDRYDNSGALAEDLSRFLKCEPIHAQRTALRDKLRRWLSSPSRRYETGLLSLFIATSVPLWIMSMILLVWVEGVDASISQELIPQAVILFLFVLFPFGWAGFQTMQGQRRAMWFGLTMSILSLIQVVPPLFGFTLVFAEMYQRHPLGRIIAYTYLTIIFAFHAVQYALLVCFQDPNRRRSQ